MSMKIQSLCALNKFIFIFALMFVCQNPLFPNQPPSKEKIIEIAKSKAAELGYSLDSMEVTYDEGNEMLKKHLRQAGVSEYNRETKDWKPVEGTTPEQAHPEVKNRNYQAVYFGPKKMQLGGDLWVYVDRETGEVINAIGGK